MAGDAQHIIIKTTNGNFATTSFGPRKVNRKVPLGRPMSWTKRQAVIQMDGDQEPAVVSDFADDSLSIFPKGSFITDAFAYSDTGAAVAINVTDGTAVAAVAALAPGTEAWDHIPDVNVNISAKSQLEWTIGAGETAVVLINYLSPETQGDGGVLHRTRTNSIVPGVDTL